MLKIIKVTICLNVENFRNYYFFMIRISNQPEDIKTNLFIFVDLVKNENIKKSDVESEQFNEFKSINNNFFVLKEIIRNLRQS